MIKYCPKCRKCWEPEGSGIAFYRMSGYGHARQYCKFCLETIPVTSRVFLKERTKHGTEMNCPNCRTPGRYDKDGHKSASFDDSIWWDWQKEKFQCIHCFLEDKHHEENHRGFASATH